MQSLKIFLLIIFLNSECNSISFQYLIISRKYKSNYTGFFSNFFTVLSGLEEAENNNLIPVIDFETYDNLYKENQPIFRTKNSWEYYFEQPVNSTVQQALSSNHLIFNSSKMFSQAKKIQPDMGVLHKGRKLIAKYVRIKPYIIEEANSYVSSEFNIHMLGVHVRGTDRRRGTPNHLMTAPAIEYLRKALELDRKFHYEKIFLACDEEDTIHMFRKYFSRRLIYNPDAYRVPANSNLTVHHPDPNNANQRQLHKFLLGKEVLLDALLLARCGHFLCGPSSVAHAAMFFSKHDQIIHEISSPGIYRQQKP